MDLPKDPTIYAFRAVSAEKEMRGRHESEIYYVVDGRLIAWCTWVEHPLKANTIYLHYIGASFDQRGKKRSSHMYAAVAFFERLIKQRSSNKLPLRIAIDAQSSHISHFGNGLRADQIAESGEDPYVFKNPDDTPRTQEEINELINSCITAAIREIPGISFEEYMFREYGDEYEYGIHGPMANNDFITTFEKKGYSLNNTVTNGNVTLGLL